MSAAEFQRWAQYYLDHPFDDLHRYHRPAALIAASMGGKYEERIAFLAPQPVPDDLNDADLRTIKALLGYVPPVKG